MTFSNYKIQERRDSLFVWINARKESRCAGHNEKWEMRIAHTRMQRCNDESVQLNCLSMKNTRALNLFDSPVWDLFSLKMIHNQENGCFDWQFGVKLKHRTWTGALCSAFTFVSCTTYPDSTKMVKFRHKTLLTFGKVWRQNVLGKASEAVDLISKGTQAPGEAAFRFGKYVARCHLFKSS